MFESRIKSLQSSLPSYEIDALLVTSSYNVAYLTGIHAFSLEEREARILITKRNIYLFTDARYTEMVKEESPFVILVEISSINPFFKILEETLKREGTRYLGFEEDNITYREIAELEEDLNNIEFIPMQNVVEKLREIKDILEIEKIRKACDLTDKGFEYILQFLKPGVTEMEMKNKLENYVRNASGDISFPSIVAFGKNSAIPHHLSSDYKLQISDIVLLDFGAKIDGYCSDMTRTVFLKKPPKKIEEMYMAVRKAQALSLDYIKTHNNKKFKTREVHNLANKYLESMDFPYIPHSIGHGVGLQVHEAPWISPYSEDELTQNMIATIEPGIYIPQLGGIRIEDTVLLTKEGAQPLTRSTKELIVI
jgi:Xaa-Pro aminopeptidase